MNEPKRRTGRPLDTDAAKARAEQLRVLADPLRLRALSVIAADVDAAVDITALAVVLGTSEDEAASLVTCLIDAGLVHQSGGPQSEHGPHGLTADAWVRFGRMLVPTPSDSATAPIEASTTAADSSLAPPVLKHIIDELAPRFSAVFSRETVERYVTESHTLLAERARISRFLPSLTSTFAADRLAALATARGLSSSGTPEVLFVCVQNAGRSQMAAAILRLLSGERVHVRTAGSAPAPTVDAVVIEALDEIGVPLAADFPKPLTDEVVRAADYVVTMGCGDACPVLPGRRYLDWDLDDPVGAGIDRVRAVRDEIAERVRGLIREMGIAE